MQQLFAVGAGTWHWVLVVLRGEEQQVFRIDVEEQPTSAAVEEQHTSEVDVSLEHDCGEPILASDAGFGMLSRLVLEPHFFGLDTV